MTDICDDFVEYLIGQANSDVAALHRFMILYDSEDSALHLFFEGDEDPSYYVPYIRRMSGSRILRTYNCGGKRNVISVREDIYNSGYKMDECLFFIDRDFDSYLGVQDNPDEFTYVTDSYSIENEIVSDECAEVILIDLVGMSHADPTYSQAVSAISRARVNFEKLIRPMMAWCLASKEAMEKPNFNNVDLAKVFSVNHNGDVSLKPQAFQKFRRSICRHSAVSRRDMLRWGRTIAHESPKIWLRGKYELWLFESILLLVLKEIVKIRKSHSQRVPRIPSALRERNLFDVVGGRVRAPASFTGFLEERLAA